MTKQEADNYLKQYIKEQTKGRFKMRASEISDFGLTGEETELEIEEKANDYISDCASDEAEYNEQFGTPQDRYNDQNEYAIVQSERYEMFRNEY